MSTRQIVVILVVLLLIGCLLACLAVVIYLAQGCFISSGLGPLPYWRNPCPPEAIFPLLPATF